MICTWRLYFFWWPFLFWKKRTKNVERKNSIIENHCVIMKKIKQIKNFMVESKRIPFYKFHVSILFVCQFYIQCKGLIPSLIFLYEGHTSNWIFHNDIISQFINALCVILQNSKYFPLSASPIQDISSLISEADVSVVHRHKKKVATQLTMRS